MKNFIKSVVLRLFAKQANVILREQSREHQILLGLKYKELLSQGSDLPSFSEVEFSCYSQNGEDGILLFIFTLIRTSNKRVVEICAGDGIECNAANLIINHGWEGLLFDGNAKAIKLGKKFYGKRTNAWRFRYLAPKLVRDWVTRENVNDLIAANGFSGEIDLLCLDMDGMDYWVWEAITCIQPRVVVLEYNNRWNANQSLTIPYREDFKERAPDVTGYFGASLKAFAKLAEKKGYRLVGANSPNTNALFMHNNVGQELFPEVSVASCLSSAFAIQQQETNHALLKDKPLVEIS